MRKKLIVAQVILLIAMIFTITACEKESGTDINFENMPVINTENAVDTNNGTEVEIDFSSESGQEDTQLEEDSNVENDVDQEPLDSGEESSKEQSITAQSIGQSGEQATNQENEQSQQQDQNPATQSIPTVTMNGTIISVGNGEFVIRKANVISSDVMVSSGEDAEKVSVIYEDNTEFVVCTSSDGGITANYAAASSANLISEKLVELQGAYEGNSFMAQKVTIYNFE
ncbi:hypothetical protein [Waltera intestinalis]|uniref:Lipoprotein n=1 Tax=Waltera intestinalis TaxID=2606635 RepID=A0A6L5YML7_9FIRM|nr:hypothetical protein [Waltera intestinalis]MST59200.1 hypothetical protein [Waltera intestinalis]